MNRHLITLVSLIFCAAPAVAATANQKSATDENGVTWDYTLTDGVVTLGHGSYACCSAGGDLTIPTTLDGYPVKVIGRYAFRQCSAQKIVIPSSVEEIGEYAFYDSTSIRELCIPASIKKIGDYAFYFFDNSDLTIYIEDMASWCGVEIAPSRSSSSSAYSRVISSSPPFSYYSSPFYCAKAVYFNGKPFPTSGELVIPDGVTRVSSGAFLGYIDFGQYGERKQSQITSIVLPDSVKEIGSFAFYGFTSIRSTLTLPASLEKIGKSAFGSAYFSSVTVPDDMPFVENLAEGLARGSSSSQSISIGEGNTNYLHVGNGLYSPDGRIFVMPKRAAGGRSYGSYEVELLESVERIAPRAFSVESSYVKRVVIPESVAEIPDCAFMRCYGLTNVVLGAQTTKIGVGAFYGCSGLLAVNLPDGIEDIADYAFNSCSKLTSVVLPPTVKTIGEEAFDDCRELTSVTIPEGVESIGENAFSWTKLTSVTIPDSVVSVGQMAFYCCEQLTNVVLGASVQGVGSFSYKNEQGRSVYVSDIQTFSYDKALQSVIVKSPDTIIGSYAFAYDLPSLRNLTLPAGTTVDANAFYDAKFAGLNLILPDGTESFDVNYLANAPVLKTLTTVLEIPPSCTKLEQAALNQLVNLTKVVFRGESFAAVSDTALLNLRMNGLDVAYIPDGGTEADGEAVLRERLGNLSQVTITSSAVREGDASVLDVQYVAAGMTNRFTVRSLAFADGVKSFANVIRTTSFVDGTAANAFGEVTANEPHVISWKIADDWDVKLGHVAFAVMTVETAELPLKLMQIPASGNHPAVRFSHNALTSARVLDALLWHYADPDCALTLRDGKLYDGGTLLASGAEPTAAGTAYVFAKMGYRLLAGAELEYVNAATRLGLVPEGARQYAVENLAQ